MPATDEGPSGADDLIGDDEAAEVLEVTPGRIGALVDEGLLTPAEGGSGGRRFRRAEVLAARELGA